MSVLKTSRTRRTMVAALALAAAVASISTPALAAPKGKGGWHGLGWDLPPLQQTKPVPGKPGVSRPLPRSESADRALSEPAAVTWPAAAVAEVDVPGGERAHGRVRVPNTPVAIGRAKGSAARSNDADKDAVTAGRVRVEVLDRKVAERVGVTGVMMRVTPVSWDATSPISVDLDYSAIEEAYGAEFGGRLKLVAYPDCVISAPDSPGCRVATPVDHVNTDDNHLVGDVAFTETLSGTGATRSKGVSPERMATSMVLAATGGSSGGGGDLTATSLSPAGTWTAGGSSGAFNYDYPITLPPPPAGKAPELALKYSSAAIDGATSATNNQPSWVGDGWGLSVGGFVERSYKSCSKDLGGNNGQIKTGDQCWATDNASLSLGASSGPLVKDTANGGWHPKIDDGSRVEKLTGAANGARNGEHWKITTPDGTQYFFGLNRLPGWASGKPETQSVFTVPVFGNHADEPCNQGSFAASWCQQAYRWNLDYVVDPNGNEFALYYQPEINYYGLNGNTSTAGTQYVRGGYLLRAEYGLNTKAGGAYAQAPARVVFDVAERCVPSGAITCDPAQLNLTTASSWPDVPTDQICNQGSACQVTGPTFFTRKRLTAVTTQVADGSGGWRGRDKWTLDHTFPDTTTGAKTPLWLDKVVHTGLAGGTAAMPPTTFGGTAKTNRTFASQNYTSLARYRITSVVNELGGTLTVDYSEPDCQSGAPDPATNTTRCYPVYWTPGGQTNPVLDWFNKYVVTDVYSDGRTALSQQSRTHYDYNGGAAWHFDENYLGEAAYRTWSQWRGYGEVVTTTGNPGDPAGPRTVAKDIFMRGMDGDKAASGTKTVAVVNSLGKSIPDSKQHQGFKRETLTYLDNQPIIGVVNDPWSTAATGTDINGVQSFITGTASTHTRAWLSTANKWRTSRVTNTFDDKGMPASTQNEGDVDDQTQTTCTRTTFVRNAAAWLLEYPSSVQTVAGPCADANPATSANILSDVHNRYDGLEYGAAPTMGNVTQVDTLDTWPSGGAETFQTTSKTVYDTVYGRPSTTEDALGRKTTTSYTPATGGPITQVITTSPQVLIGGVATSLTSTDIYDPVTGMVSAKVDAAGLRTDYTHDPLGRVTAVWTPGRSKAAGVPADAVFSYTVNTATPSVVASGKLLASGQYATTYSIVDGLGRTVQTQAPTPYAQGGRVLTDTLYDSQGRSWKTHNPYWHSAAPGGGLHIVEDTAVPNTTVKSHDSAGRPVASSYLLNGFEQWRTTTVYDGDRVTTIPPAGGTATAVVSNGLGQKVRTLQYQDRAHTGPTDLADMTTYTYLPSGQLATVKDSSGKNTWSFTYDLRGNKVSQVDPDSGPSSSTYDAAGQLLNSTDSRGKKITYTYDNLGRKTASHDGATGTKLTSFVYDSLQKGKPTSSVRFAAGKAYVRSVTGYDPTGKPTGSKVTIPAGETGLSGSYTFSTTYNQNTGLVATESTPGIGGLPAETIYRDYDALGNPTESFAANGGGGPGTKLVSKTEYNPFGQVLRVNFAAAEDPLQVSTTATYEDGTNRLNSLATVRATATGQWVLNRAYSYTQAGSLTKISNTPPGSPADTQCFGYDHLQRLTKAWTPASGDCAAVPTVAGLGGAAPYWKEWTHDSTGNRLTETRHASAGNSVMALDYPDPGEAQPHAVTTASTNGTATHSYEYDEAGNTLTRTVAGATHKFTYDVEGRAATATDPSNKTSTYVYDAEGNRLITKDPTGSTLSLGDTELFVPTGTTTATGTRFYTHGGQQVAVRTNAGLTWKIADHHGTATTSITASTLAVTQRYQDPFGNTRGSAPASWPDKHGFIGGYQDTTSLIHIGAREYDPSIGRFTSVDPVLDLKDPQSWTGYAYANNNPIDHSDPTGLFCDSCGVVNGEYVGVNCPPCSSDPQEAQHDYEVQTGLNEDPARQPKIAGQRLPTFKELKQRPGYSRYMVSGTYAEAISDWAKNKCMHANDFERGFCSEAQMYGLLEPKNPTLHKMMGIALIGLVAAPMVAECIASVVCARAVIGMADAIGPGGVGAVGVSGAAGGVRAADAFADLMKAARITATQAPIYGTYIPKSFEMITYNGHKLWFAPNATKHIMEDTKKLAFVAPNAQYVQFNSLLKAVNASYVAGPPKYDELVMTNGWELIFTAPRQAGQSPVLKHARHLGGS